MARHVPTCMIPYIELTTIHVGPITLYVWGIFVALGFLFGAHMGGWFAQRHGLVRKVLFDLLFWAMVGGLVGGRLGYMLFYNFEGFIADPLSTFNVWDGGLSLFGGLILASVLGIWYLKRSHLDVWAYSDAAFFGLPFGLWIGRIGCFLIHDHPGTATDFFLGVQYPDGVTKHDHGLYLSINGLALGLFMLWLARKPRPVGTFIATFAVWYGTVRFILDFYRVADVRYGGLTPAQYLSLALFAFGLVLFYTLRNQTSLWKVKTKDRDFSTETQK